MTAARWKGPRPTSVDFETLPIEGRPSYPPVPVGVSIKKWDKKARYYAWGHPTGNNCSREDAEAALRAVWDGDLLMHNGKFDLDVANVHLDLPLPPWERCHDTLYLLYLDNPHRRDLKLKTNAQLALGMEPEERDAVVDWLIENQPEPALKRVRELTGKDRSKLTRATSGPNAAAAYIAYAPGDVVGPYANGDVDRTEALFRHLYPSIARREMLAPYDRERHLQVGVMEMERQGLRVDLDRLRTDVASYGEVLDRVTRWCLKRMGVTAGWRDAKGREFNPDSRLHLIAAWTAAEVIDLEKLGLTKKGQVATDAKAIMRGGVTDCVLAAMLAYRARLKTCLGTFMGPWLAVAERSGGLVFTTWNQTRGNDDGGTRTGRLSSTPNHQNMSNEFGALFKHEAHLEEDPARAKLLVKAPFALPQLPLCRSYIVPFEKGDVLVGRDYCFSPDTEILTRDGFVRFDRLKKNVDVAQWNTDGSINFVRPTAYQKVLSVGPLKRIVGDRSVDVLTTATHSHLFYNVDQCSYQKTPAVLMPRRAHKIVQAGLYAGVRDDVDPNVILLAVALQADATVKSGGDRVVWKMKKLRKRERLRDLFSALGLSYVEVPLGDQVSVAMRASLVPTLSNYLDLRTKTFKRSIVNLHVGTRQAFIRELGYWDGSRQSNACWVYYSTNVANVELATEIAVLSGFRCAIKSQVLKSGKTFASANIRENYMTYTDTFRTEDVPHGGYVYCVTVPSGVIIVRRNGKMMVTGQSQQEPRILGHFEGGALLRQYQADPWMDFHDNNKANVERLWNRPMKRKPIKNIGLGLIYAQGAGSLAEKNGESLEDTKKLKSAILDLYPGLKDMNKLMKQLEGANQPYITWGGREYFCEPPRLDPDTGKVRTFGYKMINGIIQGSAADCTKEALIRFFDATTAERSRAKGAWRVILQVHDEIVISVPVKDLHRAQELLRACMESVEFDLPILSEGSSSTANWASMKDYDKKGKRV